MTPITGNVLFAKNTLKLGRFSPNHVLIQPSKKLITAAQASELPPPPPPPPCSRYQIPVATDYVFYSTEGAAREIANH